MTSRTIHRRIGCLLLAAWAGTAWAENFEIDFTTDGPIRRSVVPATVPSTALVVNSPVADLRRAPSPVDPAQARRRPYPIDDNQETQLLHGEMVRGY